MKFLPIFLLLLALSAKSQDLIITQENDTIQCKINAITEGNIYYTIKTDTKYKHASIAEIDVLGYNKSNGGTVSKVEIKSKVSRIEEEIFQVPHVRIGLNVFYSKRLASLPENLSPGIEEHYKQLLHGVGFSSDFVVFVNEVNGIGLEYSKATYSANTDNVRIDSSGVTLHGPAEFLDDVEIVAFSPMYFHRFVTQNPRNVFIVNMGLAFVGFQQITTLDDLYAKIWGNTVGVVLGGEYSYRIDRNFSLGVGLKYETGVVTTYSVDNGTSVKTYNSADTDYAEDLQRIGLSVKGLLYF